MKHPLVSVIVPCYKQAHFLPETLNSVLNQSFQNWECIIVNDGSPDHTDEVATEYCKRDQRFRYIYKENGGLSSARNAGIIEAKGSFLQFLDSDDILGKDKIERQITLFTELDLDVVLSGCYMFKKTPLHPFERIKIPLSNNFNHDILFRWDSEFTIPIHCGLFRALFFGQEKILFNEQLAAKEDWFMWVQLSLQTNKVYFDGICDVFYRCHSKGMSKDYHKMLNNQLHAFFAIDELLIDPEVKSLFRKSIGLKIEKQFFGRAYLFVIIIRRLVVPLRRLIQQLKIRLVSI